MSGDTDKLAQIAAYAEDAATVREAARSHLASNGDWNVNDWRDIAAALLAQAEAAADMETALERVRENAKAWHGNDGVGTGQDRALSVIAEWCDAVLSAREEPELDPADLRVERWGRQEHPTMDGVNRSPRGVQITHLPTGVSGECDEEKSQLRNKERALEMLRERLSAREEGTA